jgi:hypothetical protein
LPHGKTSLVAYQSRDVYRWLLKHSLSKRKKRPSPRHGVRKSNKATR